MDSRSYGLDSQRNWALREFRKLSSRVELECGTTPAGRRRARAGEKFLMAHFPASLSMNRLAGSSGTQKVCEATKVQETGLGQ